MGCDEGSRGGLGAPSRAVLGRVLVDSSLQQGVQGLTGIDSFPGEFG